MVRTSSGLGFCVEIMEWRGFQSWGECAVNIWMFVARMGVATWRGPGWTRGCVSFWHCDVKFNRAEIFFLDMLVSWPTHGFSQCRFLGPAVNSLSLAPA